MPVLYKINLLDINEDLISTFRAVRDKPRELIKYLRRFKENNSKEFYYGVRSRFNARKITGIRRCAAFIYLNKTCFNGIYRVNAKNEFNVPYGKHDDPEIFREETIHLASELLKGVHIKNIGYELIVPSVKKNDFVYLDPCYDPLKKTSFANYTSKRFTDEDNEKLALFVNKLKNKGARVLLSNNVTNNVERLYPQEEFNKQIVYCPRSINCVATARGQIQEFLITNY